jgi:class 3 adenylate cyclase/tetratricopeptide (TPR) repeat protein
VGSGALWRLGVFSIPTGTARIVDVEGPSPRPYTPPHLADKILKSRSVIEGERKQVTVLFCDLANSTALAHRLGPDVMHSLLNAFFEMAAEAIHRYEGTINQFLGDGLMALFGAPLAHEDHARRASLAALEIQRSLRERRDRALGTGHWNELALRIGLNTGLVVVGKIGDNLRMDYTAIGDTTNLAARAQQLAGAHEIYLTDSTRRAAAAYVDCQALGPKRIKGKADPVTMYRLLGVRTRAESQAADELRWVVSSLLSRDQEMATLTGCVDRLAHGEGGIVAVLGDAGLGKSRLMTEVRRAVADRGVRWLEGRGVSYGQGLSYWPFLEILRVWAGLTERDGEAEAWTRLENPVKRLFPDEHAEIVPYLATLMGLRVPAALEDRVKHLDGRAMGRQIFRASRRLFERLAGEQPLILVFEDLHWSDHSSTELVEHLLPLVETVPLLLCGVGRPGHGGIERLREAAQRNHAARYTEISLTPLSEPASAALIANLIPGVDIPPRLRDRILQKTDGNPFFVEEVVRSLIDTGALVRNAATGRWRVAVPLEDLAIPDTVQGVIMARVDRLDEDEKGVLKIASVVGRSFFYRVLQALTGPEHELDVHLRHLERIELIRERQRTPELQYIFNHGLAQEAIYESILVEHRHRLHERVAECIERLFADRLDEFYGVLAYHYAQATAWERAQDYLLKAGDQAGKVAADAEALAHYRRAVEAYARAFGDRWDHLQRATLERKIGEAFLRRGDHRQAIDSLHGALGLLGAPLPTTPGAVALGLGRELLRQAGHRVLPRRLWQATTVDAVDRERLYIYRMMPWIDYFVDKTRYMVDVLVVLNFSESRDEPVGMVQGCTGVGIMCDHLGAFRVAGSYHRRALARAEASGERRAAGDAHLGLAFHESYLGRLVPAIEACRRAAAAYRESGQLREWAAVVTLMGRVLLWRGDVIGALGCAQQLVHDGRDSADPMLRAWGLFVRGEALSQVGPLDEAIGALRTAAELYAAMPDYSGIADANGVLGRCYLRLGRVAQAVTVLEDSERVIAVHGLRGHQITVARNALTEAYLAVAEHADGAERGAYLSRAKRASRAALRQGGTFRPGLPHAMRLEGRRAWLEGRGTAARRWWQRSIALGEALEVPYDVAISAIDLARLANEPGHLRRAVELLAAMGATDDLATARRLMPSA